MDIAIVGAGLGCRMTALGLEQHRYAPCCHGATSKLRPLGVGVVIKRCRTEAFGELGPRKPRAEISVDAIEPIYDNEYGREIHREKRGADVSCPHTAGGGQAGLEAR